MRTMPFGKYRGVEVGDLPDDYLLWLRGVELRCNWLRAAVDAELERRRLEEERHDDERRYSFVDRLNAPRPEVADELIGAGLRSLARRYHPDAMGGGDARRMVEINGAADWLRQQARALVC
jgi:Putative quorum-sensing-regulated virulence factor